MSKGDWKRPRDSGVSKEQYDKNFEAAFGKKEVKTWDPEDDEILLDFLFKDSPDIAFLKKEHRRLQNEQEKSVQDQSACEGGSRGGTEGRDARTPNSDESISTKSSKQSPEAGN